MSYLELAKNTLAEMQHNRDSTGLCGKSQDSPVVIGQLQNQSSIAVNDVINQTKIWTGSDPKRWERVHKALIRIYAPHWGAIDARDIIIAWAAGNLAVVRARVELSRLQSLRDRASRRESDARKARMADISFWHRLVGHLETHITFALSQDTQATYVLLQIVNKGY